ncbi:MAG: prepilin-type N-terminal cleavage/methylation domain-containing protein [Candidatus Omnitrophica bacterium]|nr:prepilin-type N-terminal cleavage/methylation domain-containing protein [Candidatus Omnitrophota bacterium]MCK5492163.1 prepilin-type N-terminal cleavage/methylation domain-containing protein [Candidatus Omnitrophota bacterium]
MRTRKGFTLVEIMIVVAIIALLAAIAIPNLLRARISAQGAAAASALHTLAAAQIQYRATNTTYGTLALLGGATPPYIDATLATGTKQGYTYAVPVNTGTQFVATAVPVNVAQANTYYIDESGVLCRSDAVSTAAPIAHAVNCAAVVGGFSEAQ